MSKLLGFVLATLVLLGVIGALLVSNYSLQGDVEALTDALSRPSQNEDALRAENTRLSRNLEESLAEVRRLEARAVPLESLVVTQTDKITELQQQIRTLETGLGGTEAGEIELATEVSAAVVEVAVAESPADGADGERHGVTHVLKRGETLQELARRYYNDQTAWRRILEANRQVVKDTRSMLPGITLFIPDAE